ncbi:MAG: hypothetical protein ABI675_15405 [Chitinophagaceae bacterium]
MIQFLPNYPIFSKVEFPAHTGPLEKGMNVGYNPSNSNGKRELQIRATYSLKDLYSSQTWEIANCQVNYTVIKPQFFLVEPSQIMEVAQDVIQALRDYLLQVTNIERHLLELPPYPIERNLQIIQECVQTLNR